MSLIRRRIDKCQESINTTDDYAYYVGMQRGLLQAQELIGMLDKPNKSTQVDGPSQTLQVRKFVTRKTKQWTTS